MTQYRLAPEVEAVADDLIGQFHRHLLGIRREYLFRDDVPNSGGRRKAGEARKITGLNAFLAAYALEVEGGEFEEPAGFFCIVITHPIWKRMSDRQRLALVDHELSHCWCEEDNEGQMRLSILPHQVEEFPSVVRRHGRWSEDLDALFDAEEANRNGQLSLLTDDQAFAAQSWDGAPGDRAAATVGGGQ